MTRKHLLIPTLLLATLPCATRAADAPLGLPGTAQTAPLTLEPFTKLPDPKPFAYKSDPHNSGRVFPATPGLPLPTPPLTRGSATIAILGDLAPTFPGPANTSDKLLRSALDQLNLLRPDLVISTGDLVPGLTRDAPAYIHQVQSTRDLLDSLKMPWYPAPGETDLYSGTSQPDDRRFESLYQKYQAPLYYSLDTGDLHLIVLDSESADGPALAPGIGAAQLRWLKSDLNRVFEGTIAGRRGQWVVVVTHRPLWRGETSPAEIADWQQVHKALVDFNRRPVVSMEGVAGSTGAAARGPRVVAVIAAARRAYSLETPIDDIHYFIAGPAAALPRTNQSDSVALRSLLLLKLETDNSSAGLSALHASLINLTGTGPAILPADTVTAHDRAALDALAAADNDLLGVTGFIDQRPATAPSTSPTSHTQLTLHNPLQQPIDISLRLASALPADPAHAPSFNPTTINPMAEGLDLPWELNSVHTIRHLAPGSSDAWPLDFTRPENFPPNSPQDAPPQLELLIHTLDSQSRTQEILLKRRIPVAPYLQIIEGAPLDAAPARGLFAWQPTPDEPHTLNPSWQIAAEADNIHLRIKVDDPIHTYWPRMSLDSQGRLLSDSVTLAWTPDEKSPPESIRRIWALPFGPHGLELWTNTGLGPKQTDLLKLDPQSNITAQLQPAPTGYTLDLTLPRTLLFPQSSATLINLSINNNDGTPQTSTRSWAQESPGPPAWGKIELLKPPTTTKPDQPPK